MPLIAVGVVVALVVFGQSPANSPSYKPADVSIGLERTPCFGACRTYKLTVGGDGSVRYEGIANVATIGVRQATIPMDGVARLLNEFLRVRFMDALDRYAGREIIELTNGEYRRFQQTTTDLPSQILTVQLGARRKQVVLYDTYPAELGALPNLIDEVTDSKRWTQASATQSTEARDAQAISVAKSMIVRQLEPTLPSVTFEEWLRTTAGTPAIRWEVNDCGEQTGNPAADRNRDFPMCVSASAPLAAGRSLYISLVVGTLKKAAGPGEAGVWSVFLFDADKTPHEIKKLADVAAAIKR